jgi:hypothetical protein
MTTPDAIMLTLRDHGPMAKTALFRAVSLRIDSGKVVHGEYGDYPEDGFDTLEFLDNLGLITKEYAKYSLTEKGRQFCKQELEEKEKA